jgi:hypothetical protein
MNEAERKLWFKVGPEFPGSTASKNQTLSRSVALLVT